MHRPMSHTATELANRLNITSYELGTDDRHEPVDRLRMAATAEKDVRALVDVLVTEAREAGSSWAEIAAAVGVTRQSAWERWATPPTPKRKSYPYVLPSAASGREEPSSSSTPSKPSQPVRGPGKRSRSKRKGR